MRSRRDHQHPQLIDLHVAEYRADILRLEQ
jgi:hypothetical protein